MLVLVSEVHLVITRKNQLFYLKPCSSKRSLNREVSFLQSFKIELDLLRPIRNIQFHSFFISVLELELFFQINIVDPIDGCFSANDDKFDLFEVNRRKLTSYW